MVKLYTAYADYYIANINNPDFPYKCTRGTNLLLTFNEFRFYYYGIDHCTKVLKMSVWDLNMNIGKKYAKKEGIDLKKLT